MKTYLVRKLITDLALPYEDRMSNEVTDVRECLALADLYIRIAYTMTIMESHWTTEGHCLRIPKTPGYGTMLGSIRGMAKSPPSTDDPNLRRILRNVNSSLVSTNDNFRHEGSSFIMLRNRLSHGQSLPSDNEEAVRLADLVRSFCDMLQHSLISFLGELVLETSENMVELVSDVERLRLNPLWEHFPTESSLVVYSHFSAHKIFYLAPGSSKTFTKEEYDLPSEERACLPEPNSNSALGRFVSDVIRDVAAFTEDYSQPPYYFGDNEYSGCLFVPWTRPTSEENQSRLDVFRVGRNNIYQWQIKKGHWQPYTSFLRAIANWEMLARRVRLGLDQFASRREEEERARLGSGSAKKVQIPPRLLEVDDEIKPSSIPKQLNLVDSVDKACENYRPSTKVFLLVGTAGLGKTELMLSAATERARLLESDPENDKPLYLFVSSTGRTLESLEDAVDSALNITKILSSQSARALCRNGMLVLLVDGFDELLGSSGYENALGSLEPWFRDLGGRGVLVASARSSYYLTQYRRSLAERTDINADHTLTEIQHWTRDEVRDYLRQLDTPEDVCLHLSDREWQLLGIPFFARAFAAWHSGSGIKKIRNIYDIVIEQFLEREGNKLRDPHIGKQLLEHDQLKDFFAEVAELMQEHKTREIEVSDLRLCAEIVVGGDLDDYQPGLSQRLTSICGLGVETSDRLSTRFGFSHEIMFDSFFSLALLNHRKNSERMLNLLKLGKVQGTVFEWLVERGVDEAFTCFEQVMRNFGDQSVSSTLSENLGAWWMSLLRVNDGVPPTRDALNLRLEDVILKEGNWSNLKLEACSIERLLIPANGSHDIDLSGTTIECLECTDASKLSQSVRNLEPAKVRALLAGAKFHDSPAAVRNRLIDLRLANPSPSKVDPKTIESVEFFLDRLKRKSLTPVVVLTNSRLPGAENQELNWIKHGGETQWCDFVAALERHGLAHWETINAGGAPKCRLLPDVPLDVIAERESNNSNVRAFWTELTGE